MNALVIDRYRQWKAPRPHPVTGDLLRPSERVTWMMMGVYRRWSLFLALQVLTLTWWLFPRDFPGGIIGWNAAWSDLAIVVEMMVGIAFFGQSCRDAVVIRAELREIKAMHVEAEQTRTEHSALLLQIADAVGVGPQGLSSREAKTSTS